MSCISRRKRAPSTKKSDSAEEQDTTVATVISSTSSAPTIEVVIPPIDDGEGQLIIDETADDKEELSELKRELTKMKKEHNKLYRELNHMKNAVAAYRGELKAMRDNSYDSQFIWRLTPASEILTKPPEHALIPDSQYYGFHVNSSTFYSSRYVTVHTQMCR